MARDSSSNDLHGGRLRVPRTRGALSGVLLILLGAWGALVPFVGPYAKFGYTPDRSWAWSAGRFWFELLPGGAVALGGLILLLGADRITTSVGGWIAAAGGTWFVLGPALAELLHLHLGSVGSPLGSSTSQRAFESLTMFSALGVVILFLSAGALGRLAVVGVRDVRAAQRRADRARDEETPPTGTDRAALNSDARAAQDGRASVEQTVSRPAPSDGTDGSAGATRIEP